MLKIGSKIILLLFNYLLKFKWLFQVLCYFMWTPFPFLLNSEGESTILYKRMRVCLSVCLSVCQCVVRHSNVIFVGPQNTSRRLFSLCYKKCRMLFLKLDNTNCIYSENISEGNRNVYYTSPQNFIITYTNSFAQQLWGLSLNFDWLVHYVKCKTRFNH